MRHQDLVINHVLESWVYPDATTRLAATGFVPGDKGRVAYQTNTGQYFRLTLDTPPTWALIAPRPSNYISFADPSTYTITSVNPTMTMVGLNDVFTPKYTGVVTVNMSGRSGTNLANVFLFGQMQYGTGTPPVNKAALAGVSFGNLVVGINGQAANIYSQFSITAILSGLSVGTQYWFDLAAELNIGGTGATGTFQNMSTNVVEL